MLYYLNIIQILSWPSIIELKNSSCQLSIFNFSWFVSHEHIKDHLIRVRSCFNGQNLYYGILLGQYITNLTKYLFFYIIKIEKIKTISGNPGNNVKRCHPTYFSSYRPIDQLYDGWQALTWKANEITIAPLL